jgi:hypothetical protein
LIERWNGHDWSTMRTPMTPPLQSVFLNAVSQSIAERWNGSRWSIEGTPTLAGGSLLWAVSCPSAAGCFAVGSRGGLPLLEHWSGASWSIQAPS